MDVVAVIDIKNGQAVHARGGDRATYAPVAAVGGEPIDGDVVRLAQQYVERLGVRTLYVADLDAIERGMRLLHRSLISQVSALGGALWVDAGVTTPDDAVTVLDAGASTVIIGLETLTSFVALTEICRVAGSSRVAFSVDLRGGVPLAQPNVIDRSWRAADIARAACDAGATTIILLDVARVGRNGGADTSLVSEVRGVVPNVRLFVGGGVRSQDDMDALGDAGCDGVLVATALMSGAIRP